MTGLGLITPLGNDVASNWRKLMAGGSGIDNITRFDASALPSRIAGEVRNFDPAEFVDKKDIKKMDLFTQLAVAAAQMAVDDSGLRLQPERSDEMGVILGAAMGGIATIEDAHLAYLQGGVKKVSPFFVPRLIANMAGGQIAIRFGLTGVNYCTSSACASGAHAVGDAFRLIRDGYQTAVIAGGSEAGVTPMTLAGFAAMRALSLRNEEPQRASRPFDRERDGFVVAEGAGVLVLESLESATARGAKIHAEVVGFGANADAHHITTPMPEGLGAAKCMTLAL
ncbi:MAG TPA: beta-ketoacyl synthase N-terminal-like domain-containing protein, partial [Terriglobales bacterium]|nr:beta-ketoacyl synthase N-terminal-like domain-containing protein [Terriglobales bacterium]